MNKNIFGRYIMSKVTPYIVSVFISLAIGGLSAFFTRNNMDIYSEVNTPPLSPPSILFPIVWTVLYILMGISAAIIYNAKADDNDSKARILFVYAVSLFVNFCWSIFFFNMRIFLFSFFWLIILWILIFRTILGYSKTNRVAAYLQIPYLIWVTFAGYLNLGIWVLNR